VPGEVVLQGLVKSPAEGRDPLHQGFRVHPAVDVEDAIGIFILHEGEQAFEQVGPGCGQSEEIDAARGIPGQVELEHALVDGEIGDLANVTLVRIAEGQQRAQTPVDQGKIAPFLLLRGIVPGVAFQLEPGRHAHRRIAIIGILHQDGVGERKTEGAGGRLGQGQAAGQAADQGGVFALPEKGLAGEIAPAPRFVGDHPLYPAAVALDQISKTGDAGEGHAAPLMIELFPGFIGLCVAPGLADIGEIQFGAIAVDDAGQGQGGQAVGIGGIFAVKEHRFHGFRMRSGQDEE